jgi:KipI family sensor histidine kinase inhibitor
MVPMGDSALLLRWTGMGRAGDPAMVGAAFRALRRARLRGVTDVVPAPASVLVRFDRSLASAKDLRQVLPALVGARAEAKPGRAHVIDVRYGGEAGPDLEEVAHRLRMSQDEVINLHQSADYTVLATGFAPGFVYLGPLPQQLQLPRREDPRISVPAGSVAIADALSGVYGVRSGGGWWLIGRTEAPTFDPAKMPPTPFAIGRRVCFRAAGR